MVEKGSAAYQAAMAEIDARQAARAKERRILLLVDEREHVSDPDIKAEINREIEEVRASD